MRRILPLLALAGLLSVGFAAVADQDDPRLGALFDRLQVAELSQGEAREIELDIWRIWD